ncbi:MAG: M48 family metalloprotease [Phycisphaerae bacterium]|nr:M48 family metalloprotease [Phycisphaerae bacterium]NIP51017.1 M48 family metalloprotease [Phycisphaerae bacterium]NIS50214.1 M48 family metalloprotease [Phycisphaerae bacterium]NIU07851.1 M48 family metalloprotease [Phycisphaerae bacterium]NIU59909.1 M48 family metalloprotease [Phycisphaerae bacterium]
MSAIITLWNDAIMDYLLAGSITAALLVPLAWVIIRAGRIHKPVYRHMIWLYALIGIAVLPLIWLHSPKLTLAVLKTPSVQPKVSSMVESNAIETTMPNENLPAELSMLRPTNKEISLEPDTNTKLFPVKAVLVGMWFVGFAFMLGRLGLGWCRIRRICSKAIPVPQRKYLQYTHNRKLKILLTSELSGPVCFGVFRPVIVLPRRMAENGSGHDLQMVLTHELAHIKRRDCWTNFFQRVLEAVFFFHPLVWLASRRLTQQREQICDNYVLADGTSADDYTMLLSRIGEQTFRRSSLQTVALYEGQLLSRVRNLLDPLHSLETRVPRRAATICTIAVLVSFFVLGGVRLGAKPISKEPAGPDTEHIETGIARVVHFPKDRSLGKLEIQDADAVRELNYWFHWTGIKGPQWEYLGQAQGDVRVPAGKRLSLIVNKTAWRDLSPLSNLRPDDLYKLSLYALPADRAKPGDRCMPHIAHLTGLKSLNIRTTGISDRGLKYIRNITSLKYLDMPYRVTDKGMSHLAELHSLKGLYFPQNSGITNTGLRHLAKMISLEEVYLAGKRMGDACLAHLRDLPRLEYLALYSKGFSDKGMVHIKDIPSLRILSFHESFPRITDAGLAHISDMPNLELLCMHGIQDITDEGIANLTKMRSLRKLNISSSQVTDKGLAYLSQIKTLERLDLPQDQKGITDKGLTYLGTLPNLRHLAISRIHFNDPKMNKEYYTDKGLAALANCRLLEELYIGSPGVTDEGMRQVARLTNLRKLMLFGCENVTNEGLSHLAPLKSLKHLHITHSKITIGGLSHLNKIPAIYKLVLHDIEQDHAGLNISGLRNLEELTIRLKRERRNNSSITQKFTAADFTCLAKLKHLRWLQGINNVTDAGLKNLSGLTNIERFSFAAAGLTDDGLKSLANMKNLNILSFSNKYPAKVSGAGRRILTDEGLRHLEGLKMLVNLRIDSDNNFSAAAIRRLRSGLPNLYHLNIKDSYGQPTGMGARVPASRQPRRPTLSGRRSASSRAVR